MENCTSLFCNKLESLQCDDSVVEKLYKLVDLVEGCKDISETYDSIFTFIENNPVSDIGSPGPLVHLLEESYPDYVPNLISSLQHCPSLTTLWMLNRIINSSRTTEEDRNNYIELLKKISRSNSFNAAVCQQAEEFYNHQI